MNKIEILFLAFCRLTPWELEFSGIKREWNSPDPTESKICQAFIRSLPPERHDFLDPEERRIYAGFPKTGSTDMNRTVLPEA